MNRTLAIVLAGVVLITLLLALFAPRLLAGGQGGHTAAPAATITAAPATSAAPAKAPSVTPTEQGATLAPAPTFGPAKGTAIPTRAATKPAAQSNAKSPFDFYILTLSWSPDYCATINNADPQQCSLGKRLGFVLHGLWPQYNIGYPSYCANAKLPAAVKAQFPELYPSASLYDHEWEKHGTCTGLSAEQYLALSKQLKDGVAVPAAYRRPEQPFRTTTTQLKKEFLAANAGFTDQTLAVFCSGSGRYLQELYVCFLPDGRPTACSSEIRSDAARSCRAADFLVRNVR